MTSSLRSFEPRHHQPGADGLFLEDPHVNTEVRPIFAYHNIADDFLGPGFVRYYALQLRYAVNDRFAVGPATELRFGRLSLQNAYGSGASVLPVPIEGQYWNGSAFAVNTLDSCTTLARSAIAQTFGAPLVSCNTAVNAASVPFSSGVGTLVLSAPGAGAQGSVLLTPNLGTAGGNYCTRGSYVAATSAPLGYLLGRWNDADNPDADATTAYDDKPGARAVFGRYAQPRKFIFYRENY